MFQHALITNTIVVSLTAFSVICNKTFYKVYTLLSHTPHHTKSPLGMQSGA